MHALKISIIHFFMLNLSNTNISSKHKSIICAKKNKNSSLFKRLTINSTAIKIIRSRIFILNLIIKNNH